MQTNDIVIEVNDADYQIEMLEERLEMAAVPTQDGFRLEITCCQ